MTRGPWIAVAVLSLLFPLQVAAASGSWLAQGSGLVAATDRWQWVATSDVGGANVKGHFSEYNSATGTGFDAEVTCLSVLANSGRIGILITQSTNPARPAGASTYITMSTTGEGSDAVNLVGADANYFVPLLLCPPPSGMIVPFDGTINIREEATPGTWFAQGSGLIAATTEHWQWVASSDVGGGNAKGHFFEDNSTTGMGFDADVTCLNASGSTARIGILITHSTNPTRPAGASTFITMSTTGQGNAAINLVGADANYFSQLTVCPPPSGYITPFDGTINVHD